VVFLSHRTDTFPGMTTTVRGRLITMGAWAEKVLPPWFG
jgi:hypothetical protein